MPDDEGLRRELVEVTAVELDSLGLMPGSYYAPHVADALLPVVERYAAQRTAEALRDAATKARVVPQIRLTLGEVADKLDELAVALAADGTEPRPAHRQDETEAGRG